MPCQTGKRNNNINTHTHTYGRARIHKLSYILQYPTWVTDGLATCTAVISLRQHGVI